MASISAFRIKIHAYGSYLPKVQVLKYRKNTIRLLKD